MRQAPQGRRTLAEMVLRRARVTRYRGREVFAFTRSRDIATQGFARELGAVWAGDATETPPALLEAAILFAPLGALVPAALQAIVKGGTVACADIL